MEQQVRGRTRVALALDVRHNVIDDFTKASEVWVAEFDEKGNLVNEVFFLRVHGVGYFSNN
jgi:hypothetical protein